MNVRREKTPRRERDIDARAPCRAQPSCLKPGGGIDLVPATIDGLKSGYINATLDQLLYLQGFIPVVQFVMTAKYKMPGLSLNTDVGTVTPKTIDALTKLIDADIR